MAQRPLSHQASFPEAPAPTPARRPPVSLAARLGWVSFFNDCSSEVLARVLPLHLALTLGAGPAFLGIVEGLADSAALLLRGFSGWLSDRTHSRKGFVVGGYAMSVGARALYLMANLPLALGLARVLDRVGKGLRSAPRDAMVADAATSGSRGRDFGITRFLDTLGSMAGIALVLFLGIGSGPLTAGTFLRCVWLALPIGGVTLALLVWWVPRVPRTTQATRKLALHIPRSIRGYLSIVFLFALANSSDAFLVLMATRAGFSFRGVLVLFLVFNALAAGLAVPAGRLSDRIGRVPLLASGWAVYAAAYAVMAFAPGRALFGATLFAYGAFYGLTEGAEKALLTDLLPPDQRGTGFGAFQSAMGLAALVASPLMGGMIALLGYRTAFLAASGTALTALAALAVWNLLRHRHSSLPG